MATWSGSDVVETSISMEGFCVERSMSASAIQLISVGWSEGRIPVVERMESPFFLLLVLVDSSTSSVLELMLLSDAERRRMMEHEEVLLDVKAVDCLLC